MRKTKQSILRAVLFLLLISAGSAMQASIAEQPESASNQAAVSNQPTEQATQVTISKKDSKIRQILPELEKMTGYSFFFNSNLSDLNKLTTIELKGVSLRGALDKLFERTAIAYQINGKQVVLSEKEVQKKEQAQGPQLIKGSVTDSKGDPIIGASIVQKGTQNGTITDIDGNFSLQISKGSTLVVSYIGFTTKEVKAEKSGALNVSLDEDNKLLNEIVVVGYGTQKKANLTGSVVSVGAETMENKAVPNAVAAIQGAMSGVVVTRANGQPGSESYNLEVRGKSSVNGMSALIIVDGAQGSMSELNPNDIETVTVLKDAAACAIYGSNAAGGVVLITTKKGRAGKTTVEYSGMFGLTKPSRMPSRVNSWEEGQMLNEASVNAGLQKVWTDEQIGWMKGEGLETLNPDHPGARWRVNPKNANAWEFYDNVDFIKELTRAYSPTQTHNLTVKGGDEKNVYMFSLGYYDRQGMMKEGPDKNNRYNARLNLNTTFNKYLSLDTWLAYTNSDVLEPSQSVGGDYGLLYSMYQIRRIYSLYDPNGNYSGAIDNPLAILNQGGKYERRSSMLDAKANLKISNMVKGLDINVIGSLRQGNNRNELINRTIVFNGALGNPIRTKYPTNSVTKTAISTDYKSLQAFATYKFDIADAHQFSLMGGSSWEESRYDAMTAGAANMVTNDFFSLNWGSPTSASSSDAISTWATLSGFGRLNYNYMEKYLIEANVRYDGSSRLSPNNRWHSFPSFSGAWRINKEDFFESDKIDNLKLRASWGMLGNANALGEYDYLALLRSGNNLPFNNSKTIYIYQSQLNSPDISWERIETSNIGVDLGMFNNRLNFTGDYYTKYNNEMLSKIERSSIVGVALPYFNVGQLKTWGWETSLSWNDKKGDFQYWLNANLSDSQNKLMKYDNKQTISEGTNGLIEGMPINTIWGYKTDGLFQSAQEYTDYGVKQSSKTGEGDVKYLDLNGDKVISVGKGTVEDHGDLVKLGEETPRYTYGFDFGFNYKGFDFSAFFQGVGSRSFLISTRAIMPFYESWRQPMAIHRDYWTPENTDASWPRLYRGGTHNYLSSDKWVQDASYIRLKNLQVGYNFPKSILGKSGISKLRVYVSGQDLWEYSKVFDFVDPEMPNAKDFIYPFYRVFSTGVNISF